MDEKTMYLEKLREISKKEAFWSASYLAQAVGTSINCMYNLLGDKYDKDKISQRIMLKVREFVDKYEKEKNGI